ncbi:minor pilin subunit PapH [Xenorhabdus mauleonii]|uniref:Minor pilin subunit PapH n=1 Tax=Xenorhabdus mauleonii TaxID=351675 RepID=A0A1I3RAB8_9GAMM|nr:fimbrial protein [Xenorhabdus mauleonii]PHM39780.1 minor pilin subunit PapH [Xenorhabdus mauleonii]SFJ42321.1 Pilin (type 1 fimbria component protein) [Xenorhabdus mauleonii]
MKFVNEVLIKKLFISLFILLLCKSALAWEHSLNPFMGRVNISGTVVSASCSIALDDMWQSVNMGMVPVKQLYQHGIKKQKEVVIHLKNCDWEQEKHAEKRVPIHVTFDGVRDKETHLFRLSGGVRGAALFINDAQGHLVRAGKSYPVIFGSNHQSGMKYSLNLVPNGEPLVQGSYYAVLSFKLSYE